MAFTKILKMFYERERLRTENMIIIIRDVFYEKEAWCNKKNGVSFKDSLKQLNLFI